jgi:hypothetical protein
MLPFLGFHAIAATRGDGLRPELRILFERLAATPEATSNGAIARLDQMDTSRSPSGMASGQATSGKQNFQLLPNRSRGYRSI